MVAELIEDEGTGAQTEEFFRSAPFHRAEGVTHTLRLRGESATASLAVVVRQTPSGERLDAISAYGYPGATVETGWQPLRADGVEWEGTALVSLFVRERLGGTPLFAQATERGRVLLHDPKRPRAVRPRLTEQIRATERRGYRTAVTPGPRTSARDRASFHAAYTQTMERTGAAERYFFSPDYVGGVLAFERSWLISARIDERELGAGAIAAASDGHLHYFLGGTANEALSDSPFKNVVAAMLDLSDELEMPLNLGGGLAPGDGLERFKRGFANADAPFLTHEVICDSQAYRKLAGGQEGAEGFFPAYRASG